MTTLYTIGHSRHTPERFVELLRARAITTLVDVRSHPVSKWAPHFAKAPLAQLLATAGVEYVFLGRELGGLVPDLAERAREPDFLEGIARLAAIARERRTAIMCAEEDPAQCHRTRLIAPSLSRAGIVVAHVRGDATVDAAQLELF